jgi:hypothetical protein
MYRKRRVHKSLSAAVFAPATWLVMVLVSWGGPDPSAAHKMDTSYSSVLVRGDTLRLVVALDEADLSVFGIDQNGDGILWRDEILAGSPIVFDYLQDRVGVAVDGKAVDLARGKASLNVDGQGNLFLELEFVAQLSQSPATLDLEIGFLDRFNPTHRNISKVRVFGSPPQPAVFSREQTHRRFVLVEPSLLDRVFEFTELGVEHIFLGYDHIMFLLALIVIGGRMRSLVKIVTAFTIAHSITLILAAQEILVLPDRLIEAGIALSIAYVAAENFWLKTAGHRWMLTFVFGLVHGFGFANVLRQLGLPDQGLIASLLAFNVGVEIGQIVIVALLFPPITWAARSRYHRRVVLVVSAVIFLFGVGWLVERIFGLSYMPI